ncbi:MAG: hypothetical protein AABW63_00625 [Nanoarchaeota archaeon]
MTNKTIEELSKEYNYLVVDTCAFISEYGHPISRDHAGVNQKIKHIGHEISSIQFFNKFLNGYGNLYTTSEVIDELTAYRVRGSRKKDIRKQNRLKTYREKRKLHQSTQELIARDSSSIFGELQSERYDLSKLLRAFTNELVLRGRVLNFVGEEQAIYNDLESQNSFLRERFNLDDTSFNLLMSSGLLALNRGKVCLITSNSQLFEASHFFAHNNLSFKENYRTFVRDKFNSFADSLSAQN